MVLCVQRGTPSTLISPWHSNAPGEHPLRSTAVLRGEHIPPLPPCAALSIALSTASVRRGPLLGQAAPKFKMASSPESRVR